MLHNLGPDLILQLMAQLLTEQKLLLVSILPDLLVETIQQLITVYSSLFHDVFIHSLSIFSYTFNLYLCLSVMCVYVYCTRPSIHPSALSLLTN